MVLCEINNLKYINCESIIKQVNNLNAFEISKIFALRE